MGRSMLCWKYLLMASNSKLHTVRALHSDRTSFCRCSPVLRTWLQPPRSCAMDPQPRCRTIHGACVIFKGGPVKKQLCHAMLAGSRARSLL